MKNLGHPTAKQTLNNLAKSFRYYEKGYETAKEISKEEFESYQYLYTKYRDELFRGLTKLDYDDWIAEEEYNTTCLNEYAYQEGIFVSKNARNIQLLCSKKLALLSLANSSEEPIIEPYGEQYLDSGINDPVLIAEKAVDESKTTNIILIGNQMLRSALNAFYSSDRVENSISCAIAGSAEKVRQQKTILEKLECLATVSGKSFVSERYSGTVLGGTVLYISKLTRKNMCKTLY